MENNPKEKVKPLCPQCGGNMEVETEGETQLLSCPFCGYAERRRPELTTEEKQKFSQELVAAGEAGRIRAREEHAYERSEAAKEQRLRKQRRKRIRTIVIVICIVLLIIAFNIEWTELF